MTINLQIPDIRELKPRITVFGCGGAGGNAVNNMITAGLEGVDFVVANTDAQALTMSKAERIIQMGTQVTSGLGAGAQPEVGAAAAIEAIDEIRDHLTGANMVFVTAGMGGGTGTGAAPIIAKTAREMNILTVGVVTKPFHFEGLRRMKTAEAGIAELQKAVDTLLIIPNQNLFRVANEKTTFAEAFALADQVLYSGVASITDLMVKEGLINLDFADVRAVMREMGKAMMGTGEAGGEKRALTAAEAAIANPLIDDSSLKGARGLLVSITGGRDMTLFEVDEAATRIREEVDSEANIIVGATFDESLDGVIRVSVVATGIDSVNARAAAPATQAATPETRLVELSTRLRAEASKAIERQVQAQSTPVAQQAAAPATRPELGAGLLEALEAAVTAPQPKAVAPTQTTLSGDVSVRAIPPKPSLFPEAKPEIVDEHEHADAPAVFIPPVAEKMPVKQTRMPTFEDLPITAQKEILQSRGEAPQQEHPQKQRLSLLQRLANVGLGRRDDETEPPIAARASGPAMPAMPQTLERPQPRPAQRPAEPVSEYARRPAPQGLDSHGRPAPIPAAPGEDHLDIPAFLRRQSN